MAGPVVMFLVIGDKGAKMLNSWKVWLTENNSTVMFILFIVLGTVLVGKGISGFFG